MSAPSIILHKRNSVSGVIPNTSSLSSGEIAVNTADGKLFIKTTDNNIQSFLNSAQLPYTFDLGLSSLNYQYGNNTVTGIIAGVLGGIDNDVSGAGSTVVNGSDNDIQADYAFIGNGANNSILTEGDFGAILGGQNNTLNHSDSFILGSNITSHLSGYTYTNNLSVLGNIYSDGVEIKAEVRTLSTSLDSVFTTVQENSSTNWDNSIPTQYAHSNFLTLSGGTLIGTIIGDLSATGSFYGDGSKLTGIVAGDTEATTLVRQQSANWGVGGTAQTISFNEFTKEISLSLGNTVSLSALGSATGDYLPLSGGTLIGTIIGDLSATGSFYGDGSKLTGIVAGDTEATTLVRSNSANWETTFQASSAYVSSNPTGITGASALTKLIQITQAGYNSITPASDTLYIIVG